MNSKLMYQIKRAKRTLLGRMLCKLTSDKTGAVMMEYVIVAVLIAAACIAGVAFFGEAIINMFGAAAQGATGDGKAALTAQEKARTTASTAQGEAVKSHNKHYTAPAGE